MRPAEGRLPEEGIEVRVCSHAELWRAAARGEFDMALHFAVLLMAVMRGKLSLEPQPC